MHTNVLTTLGMTIVTAALVVGCSNQQSASISPDSTYLATTEPTGAVPVGDAKASEELSQEIVLVGRIGGSAKPFIDGLAAFTIVDPKVPHCSSEEGCPTPWDYCCEQNQVKDNIATVKIVNQGGQPVAQDARELLGVKELNMVVVHGSAQRDAEGNLSVLADKIYIKE